MSYAFIAQSVGKNGKNIHEDVMSIQIRLNRWIMENKLPGVPMLAVDGDCGAQSRKAIGAFQKLYLGMNNPDCRVDPGGKTLDALFQSLISPQASKAAYDAWLKAQSESQSASTPKVDWTLTAAEVAHIRKNWGEEALAWARIPPNGIESKEFIPYKLTENYAVLFGWKSLTLDAASQVNGGSRLQFFAMLRDDMSYWRRRADGNEKMAIILQYAAACAIRDYRQFIIGQKLSPKAAYNRLVSIGKDVIYQMFLGMFQLLSPIGLARAPAWSGAVADATKTLIEGIKTGNWPWTPSAKRH